MSVDASWRHLLPPIDAIGTRCHLGRPSAVGHGWVQRIHRVEIAYQDSFAGRWSGEQPERHHQCYCPGIASGFAQRRCCYRSSEFQIPTRIRSWVSL